MYSKTLHKAVTQNLILCLWLSRGLYCSLIRKLFRICVLFSALIPAARVAFAQIAARQAANLFPYCARRVWRSLPAMYSFTARDSDRLTDGIADAVSDGERYNNYQPATLHRDCTGQHTDRGDTPDQRLLVDMLHRLLPIAFPAAHFWAAIQFRAFCRTAISYFRALHFR